MVVWQMKHDIHPARQSSHEITFVFCPMKKLLTKQEGCGSRDSNILKLNLVYRASKQQKTLYIKVCASLVGLAKGWPHVRQLLSSIPLFFGKELSRSLCTGQINLVIGNKSEIRGAPAHCIWMLSEVVIFWMLTQSRPSMYLWLHDSWELGLLWLKVYMIWWCIYLIRFRGRGVGNTSGNLLYSPNKLSFLIRNARGSKSSVLRAISMRVHVIIIIPSTNHQNPATTRVFVDDLRSPASWTYTAQTNPHTRDGPPGGKSLHVNQTS